MNSKLLPLCLDEPSQSCALAYVLSPYRFSLTTAVIAGHPGVGYMVLGVSSALAVAR